MVDAVCDVLEDGNPYWYDVVKNKVQAEKEVKMKVMTY